MRLIGRTRFAGGGARGGTGGGARGGDARGGGARGGGARGGTGPDGGWTDGGTMRLIGKTRLPSFSSTLLSVWSSGSFFFINRTLRAGFATIG